MKPIILAIDPGTDWSAYVLWDCDRKLILEHEFLLNKVMLAHLSFKTPSTTRLYIEGIASYGMPVGAEVFQTCYWIGKFMLQWELNDNDNPPELILRKQVKETLCHSAKAKDGNVRQALIDRLGPPGTKKNPGKTYGISKHIWSALAVAVTADILLHGDIEIQRVHSQQ